MNFWSIFAFALGLSMDAFAVSVCKGLSMKKINILQMVVISFAFGLFQFLMPIIGYFLCVQFEGYIVSFDHWIAFSLLAFIGGKMVFEALKERKESLKQLTQENEDGKNLERKETEVKSKIKCSCEDESRDNQNKFSIKEIIFLAIATSIDALAVGITFAFFNINIFTASSIIGLTTFVLCCIGVLIGNFFGSKFKTFAEVAGGIILILMGIKILLEHLEILVF